MSQQIVYDVIIIGGGPAGYTAGLYSARSSLKTLILEKMVAGGQMANTYEIDNYPGTMVGISGYDLAQKMKEQAERFGAESQTGEVVAVDFSCEPKTVTVSDGEVYSAKAVILAMGARPRQLFVPGEDKFRGRGVSYCATCDGMFFKGKTVVVVGGGNTALEDALFLSKVCEKVYLVHRRDTFRGSAVYVDLIQKKDNIQIVYNDTVTEILGDQNLTGVRLQSGKELDCQGVFVAIGNLPNTKLVEGILDLDDGGYIVAGESTETNVAGVFAAGDLREKPLCQIVTAVSDGAVAAYMAETYLLR